MIPPLNSIPTIAAFPMMRAYRQHPSPILSTTPPMDPYQRVHSKLSLHTFKGLLPNNNTFYRPRNITGHLYKSPCLMLLLLHTYRPGFTMDILTNRPSLLFKCITLTLLLTHITPTLLSREKAVITVDTFLPLCAVRNCSVFHYP